MVATANLEADMHLATAQDGVLREENDGQGLRLSSAAWRKKGEK